MSKVSRPFMGRTRDRQQARDVYFCQQAVFALMRAGASRRAIRFAQRDLDEARQDWQVSR